MADPTQELQEEIIVRLRETPAVTALVSTRIYDLPQNATAPYISMGPASAMQDDAECIEAQEVTLQIDCWSDQRGFKQVRAIADAVRCALRADLPFQANAIVTFEHRITRYLRDPGGISSHAAMTFRAVIETA